MRTFSSTTASLVLPDLLRAVMEQPEQPSRNGTTKELRYAHIALTHPMVRGIETPGRKASLPAQIAETMWLLAGRGDIGWLSNYLPRASEFSDDGETWRGAYGPRIRCWDDGGQVDQLRHVVELLRREPDTRRAVISIYDPSVDTLPGKDIPCNNWLHFLARDGRLDLHVVTRSNDVIWGWSGINAFEWSVLLEIVAHMAGLATGELHFTISSLHIYKHHYARAEKMLGNPLADHRGSTNPAFSLTGIRWGSDPIDNLDKLIDHWFEIEELIRTGSANANLSIDDFPEPMMRSWLHVLHYYWTGDEDHLAFVLGDTNLFRAALASPKRKTDKDGLPAFKQFVADLHAEKSAAYGDSWRKRGEQVSILANIARKVDRLLSGKSTSDETLLDTAIDLWVYLMKYSEWLTGEDGEDISNVLQQFNPDAAPRWGEDLESSFERVLQHAEKDPDGYSDRHRMVETMMNEAGAEAFRLWKKKNEWKRGNATRQWEGYES